MKLLHLVFSIYLLFLSSFACTDEYGATNERAASQISTNQTSNPHEDETCSPFCICACCGSLAVHFSARMQQSPQEIVFNNFSIAEEKNVIAISLSVWQPPKLV